MAKLDTIRMYDDAVMTWLEGEGRLSLSPVETPAAEEAPVPVVFATPERSELGLLRKLGLPVQSKAPYPYMSVARVGWEYDWTRRSTVEVRKIVWSDDGRSVAQARFPFPVDFLYQWDFWSRRRTHGNLASMWMAEQFPYEGGEGRIFTIDFKVPWGKKWIRGFIQNMQDLTPLESDETDRVVRVSAQFVLKGWLFQCYDSLSDLPYDPTKITYRRRTIISGVVDIVDYDNPEIVYDQIRIPE